MSQENVEVARNAFEGFNARDLEQAMRDMDPNIEWRPLGVMTHGEVVVGLDGVRRFFEEWMDSFDDFRLIVEEIVEAPTGALATTRASGRGARSGLEMTGIQFFQVVEIRDGKIQSLQMFGDREEALEAAGLSE